LGRDNVAVHGRRDEGEKRACVFARDELFCHTLELTRQICRAQCRNIAY
jgi:hypothetical protein